MSYLRLRDKGRHLFPAEQVIRSIKLYHRQIYRYAFHRPKLEFLRTGTLDDKRLGDTRFAPVADFLESIPTTCPSRSVQAPCGISSAWRKAPSFFIEPGCSALGNRRAA